MKNMKKRGLIITLLIVLIIVLNSFSVSAYHGIIGAPSYMQTPTYGGVREGGRDIEVPETTPFERGKFYNGNPDLVVEKINAPNELPTDSILGQTFSVVIKNVGEVPVEGQVNIQVELLGKHVQRCKLNIYAGGTYGGGPPYGFSKHKLMRYLFLIPGDTFEVPVYDWLRKGSQFDPEYGCLTRVLKEDLTIRATVNPITGSAPSGSLKPSRRIRESDVTNNVLEKTVKIKDASQLDSIQIPVSFKEGMNAFSVPVIQKMTANDFVQGTGCSLYSLKEEYKSKGFGNRRAPEVLDQTELVSISEVLKIGTPYFAKCESRAVVTFEGKDPGQFDTKLVGRAFTPVTTRSGMIGRRLFQLVRGCSNLLGGDSFVMRYVKGNQNLNNKLLAENVYYTSLVVPGELYFVFCDTTFGTGVWDPSLETQNLERPIGSDTLSYNQARILGQSDYETRYKGDGTFGGSRRGQTFYYRWWSR